jgi:hypothetical protein
MKQGLKAPAEAGAGPYNWRLDSRWSLPSTVLTKAGIGGGYDGPGRVWCCGEEGLDSRLKTAVTTDLASTGALMKKEVRRVVLTGQAPVWLYLKVAHALHGKARKLIYASPVTGEIVIFDHDPF